MLGSKGRLPQGPCWAAAGRGKRGGARVIHTVAREDTIWLLIVHTKARFDDPPAEFLAQLKRDIENDQ
jgi:hypothetical protein